MADNSMDLLTSLLSNPQAVENIKNIIGGMANSSQNEPEPAREPEPEPESRPEPPHTQQAPRPQTASVPDMSFLTNILANSNQNVEIMNKMKQAYDVYASEDDPSINLLHALSPYLSQKRTANLEKVITMVKVGKAASVFGKNMGK